jgi:hypothetical protein
MRAGWSSDERAPPAGKRQAPRCRALSGGRYWARTSDPPACRAGSATTTLTTSERRRAQPCGFERLPRRSSPHGYVSQLSDAWPAIGACASRLHLSRPIPDGAKPLPPSIPPDEPLLDLDSRGHRGSDRLLCCPVLRHLELMAAPALSAGGRFPPTVVGGKEACHLAPERNLGHGRRAGPAIEVRPCEHFASTALSAFSP